MTYIYADHAATSPLHPAAQEVLSRWLQNPLPANPSSVHQFGMDAADLLASARESLLTAMVGEDHADWQLTFTSGGTEGASLAVWSLLQSKPKNRTRVLLSPMEHPAVWEAAARLAPLFGCTVETCRVTADGVIDLVDFAARMGEDLAFAAVMTVQNETGVIQPVQQCAALVHACGGLFFTDAVQAAGHMALPVHGAGDTLPDVLTLSAHKFGGMPGVGCVLHRIPLTPLQKGGGQESGIRGGTENLPGILTMAAAATAWPEALRLSEALRALKESSEAAFLHRMQNAGIPAVAAGMATPRIPTTTLLVFRDIPGKSLPLGETIVLSADLSGLAISAGSACHSHLPEPSRALLAMDFTESEASRAVRLSFGTSTSSGELTKAYEILGDILERLYIPKR